MVLSQLFSAIDSIGFVFLIGLSWFFLTCLVLLFFKGAGAGDR